MWLSFGGWTLRKHVSRSTSKIISNIIPSPKKIASLTTLLLCEVVWHTYVFLWDNSRQQLTTMVEAHRSNVDAPHHDVHIHAYTKCVCHHVILDQECSRGQVWHGHQRQMNITVWIELNWHIELNPHRSLHHMTIVSDMHWYNTIQH